MEDNETNRLLISASKAYKYMNECIEKYRIENGNDPAIGLFTALVYIVRVHYKLFHEVGTEADKEVATKIIQDLFIEHIEIVTKEMEKKMQ